MVVFFCSQLVKHQLVFVTVMAAFLMNAAFVVETIARVQIVLA
jgi:hypothetical protein